MTSTIYYEKQRKMKYKAYLKQKIEAICLDSNLEWKEIWVRKLNYASVHNTENNKVRIYYHISMENESELQIFLEEKIMLAGNFVKKNLMRISAEECSKIIKGDIKWMNQSNTPLLNRFYFQLEINQIRPVGLIECKRELMTGEEEGTCTIFESEQRISPEKAERFLEEDLLFEDILCPNRITKIIRVEKEMPFHMKNTFDYAT